MQKEKYYQQFLTHNLYPRELKTYELEKLINFSSNDYLGLSRHPKMIKGAQEFTQQFGTGVSSSRSVVGNLAIYEKLEKLIAKNVKKEAALILGSGFQANFSVLESLLDSKVLGELPHVFIDKLAHASLIQGLKLIKNIHRFQHNNLTHLAFLLDKYKHSTAPKFIFVESLYSMDGDYADLKGLTDLAEQHKAMLYVDDAHSVGVEGPSGWGRSVEYADKIDIIMGTFSKGLGSFGSYIACSKIVRDYLINKCKGFIYSTGLSPSILGAIHAAVEILPELNAERLKVRNDSSMLRQFFQENDLDCGASESQIIPWIIGDAEKTLRATALLEEEGILASPIRPPSVPSGKSRIRFCISATHTEENIFKLMEAVIKARRLI